MEVDSIDLYWNSPGKHREASIQAMYITSDLTSIISGLMAILASALTAFDK